MGRGFPGRWDLKKGQDLDQVSRGGGLAKNKDQEGLPWLLYWEKLRGVRMWGMVAQPWPGQLLACVASSRLFSLSVPIFKWGSYIFHCLMDAWRASESEDTQDCQSPATLARLVFISRGFPGGSAVKNPPANARDSGSVSGSGRSPEEGYGNPLQYSCLGNHMDRGAWRATVYGVAKNRTIVSD